MENFKLEDLHIHRIVESEDDYKLYGEDFLICNVGSTVQFDQPIRTEFAIVLCTEGEVDVSINLRSHKLQKGVMVVNFPQNIIQLENRSPDFSGKAVLMSEKFVRSIVSNLKPTTLDFIRFQHNPCMELQPADIELFEKHYDLLNSIMGTDDNIYKSESIRNILLSLYYNIKSLIDRHTIDMTSYTRHSVIFYEFILLLNQHYLRERKVSFYADKFNLSPKYFSSIIKAESDKSAAEWIDEYLIIEAQSQLRHTKLSVQEIAYNMHFTNTSFFGKFFKQHMGISPGEYRKG